MEDRKTHVAFLAGSTDIGIAGKALGPGVVDGVAFAISAEAFHHLQDLAGMIGLFEHDAGGRNTLLDTRRVIDDIGKTGGAASSLSTKLAIRRSNSPR